MYHDSAFTGNFTAEADLPVCACTNLHLSVNLNSTGIKCFGIGQ